ncbi:MAG: multiple sugar transport system substrate-binding protein [Candidatus Atribacteria bacterium]|uniref:ABC transporter substrate-binding protein n=1 Tax=Atrimonas thermophila TaxID=3064161 RepID=UPI0024AC22DE|nr:multiple sugar transport system substrate-binding protein [Candidatus Atribacteria bacterium]
MKFLKVFLVGAILLALSLPALGQETVEIEFMQWWQPEMKGDSFDQMIKDFELQNPNIKVKPVTLPYAEVRDQLLIQAAGKTLPDVVGVDPQWMHTLIKYNVIENLDAYIERDGIDVSSLALKKIKGSAWIFPVTSYIYPLFYNIDLLKEAGFEGPPKTREEFLKYAEALTKPEKGQYAWVLPLSLSLPNGISNDICPWLWAAGFDIMKDGKPYLNHQGMIDVLKFINELYQKGFISPGTMGKREPEKVEEFANARVAMMISSVAHINILRERNPNLNFSIAAIPAPAGYEGPPALRVASWDIGISAASSTAEKEAAWKLIKYITSPEVNSFVCSNANAFPGNLLAKPDYVGGDPVYELAYDLFTKADLKYPLVGAPEAFELERSFAELIHAMFQGEMTPEEVAVEAQKVWEQIFAENE